MSINKESFTWILITAVPSSYKKSTNNENKVNVRKYFKNNSGPLNAQDHH